MTSEISDSPAIDPTQTTSSQSSSSGDLLQTNKSQASDAPLLALLRSFQHGFSNIEEAQAYVKELQTLRLVPTTLRSRLQAESNEIEKIRPTRRSRPPKVVKKPLTAEEILKQLSI